MRECEVSVVTTLYRSEEYVAEFYRRICNVVSEATQDFQIIFVNDGSPDNSGDVIKQLAKNDKRLVFIELSRNFGHHKAILCGLSQAKGKSIFLIDVDLEEQPEDFLKYWEFLKKDESIDVVYGYQKNRKGKFFERLSGWFFYTLMEKLSDIKMPRNLLMSRLMSKRYVTELLSFEESEFMLAGLFELTGFKQVGVEVKKLDKGSTSYTLSKKINMMVNAITSLSNKPLYYIFYLGIITVVFALVVVIYVLLNKIFYDTIISGWTSIIASLWLLSGIILTSTGLVSIYLSKIFLEVKKRPRFIIKEIVRHD